jgi:hypothetical protein
VSLKEDVIHSIVLARGRHYGTSCLLLDIMETKGVAIFFCSRYISSVWNLCGIHQKSGNSRLIATLMSKIMCFFGISDLRIEEEDTVENI